METLFCRLGGIKGVYHYMFVRLCFIHGVSQRSFLVALFCQGSMEPFRCFGALVSAAAYAASGARVNGSLIGWFGG